MGKLRSFREICLGLRVINHLLSLRTERPFIERKPVSARFLSAHRLDVLDEKFRVSGTPENRPDPQVFSSTETEAERNEISRASVAWSLFMKPLENALRRPIVTEIGAHLHMPQTEQLQFANRLPMQPLKEPCS